MTTYRVKLNSMDKVRNFVNTISEKEGKYELVSDYRIVNAKSILGVFSLDLSRTLELRIENDRLPAELEPFRV
ncbi:MAG: HPr family phosphocarrier protein [Muricoprocola sp.]